MFLLRSNINWYPTFILTSPRTFVVVNFLYIFVNVFKAHFQSERPTNKKKHRGPHRTGTRFKTWTQYFPKTYKKGIPRDELVQIPDRLCVRGSLCRFISIIANEPKKTKIKPEMSNKKCRILKDVLRILIIIFKLFQIFL